MRIGVVGCAGRMGQMLVREIVGNAQCRLAGGSEAPGHHAIGRDIGELAGLEPLGIRVGDDAAALFARAEAVIDFTTPAATQAHASLAAANETMLVVGTTGLGAEAEEVIRLAAQRVAVVWSPNMSIGVNLLMALVERVSASLDARYDIEIVEMHHRHKVDAPSGTALGLGRAAAKGRGVALDAVAQRARDGHTGPRVAGNIGFAVLRGGDVVGDHTVVFAGEGERLELTHRAGGRQIYAQGAVRAALWTQGKAPGLYTMRDVLGF
ncbi:MAG TPA: 4-hydroxy-tetrahydrodipicolinate reductase [Alphaproteobacteria bacterium]|nr:4-hydroxy-tetrahydrodipicolinate reductase [Alphaproteobacteria bacterium]